MNSKFEMFSTQVMMFFVLLVVLAVAGADLSCKNLNCKQWSGCDIWFNETRCRCEGVCLDRDVNCDNEAEPCLTNNHCYWRRQKGEIQTDYTNCMCSPHCVKEPKYDPGLTDGSSEWWL